MTGTSLRVGFLVSGLLHVAIVAAFSQSSMQPVPAADQPQPLSLKLSAFSPPQPAPDIQLAPESPQQEVVVEVPEPPPSLPDEPPAETTPPPVETVVESVPKPVPAEPVAVERPRPKPRQLVRAKPPAKKMRPSDVRPVASTPVKVAVATDERPQAVAPPIDTRQSQHYLAALAAKLNRSKYYPRASRRRGEEGTVVVSFVIQRNGALTHLFVTESSGYSRLDKAALKTLRRVTPFKPIPDALKRDQWPISVPIAFSLGG